MLLFNFDLPPEELRKILLQMRRMFKDGSAVCKTCGGTVRVKKVRLGRLKKARDARAAVVPGFASLIDRLRRYSHAHAIKERLSVN